MIHPDGEEEIRSFCLQIGKLIAEKRKKIGISQDELAYRTGYHRTYMGIVERGEKTPTIWTLKRISEELNIPLSKLLKEAGF